MKVTSKVLIIEDNEMFSRIEGIVLRKAGHEVRVANTGTKGIVISAQMKPDVVFVDLRLPDMDGTEAAQRIDLQCDPCPIFVGMTGHLPSDIIAKLEPSCLSFCIQKPMGMTELTKVLTDAVKRAEFLQSGLYEEAEEMTDLNSIKMWSARR